MRTTCVCAVRAVRMYVPMHVAATGGAHSSSVSAAGDTAATSIEVRAARRITEAVLRARANRKLQQPLSSPLSKPVHAKAQGPRSPASDKEEAIVKDTVSLEMQTAARLALSYGKSAFMTHLVHQHDDVYQRSGAFVSEWDQLMMGDAGESEPSASTVPSDTPATLTLRAATPQIPRAAAGILGLQMSMDKRWDELTDEARVRWITSTSQGRRALQHATKLAKFRNPTRAQENAGDSDARVVPSMEAMLSKYKTTLVLPRLPRVAALAPSPKEPILRAKLQHGTDESASPTPKLAAASIALSGVIHVPSGNNANRRHLRDRADAVRREERRKLWRRALIQFLGGDAAFMFVNDVKDLQQPRTEAEQALKQDAGVPGGDRARPAATMPSTSAAKPTRDVTPEEAPDDGAQVAFSDGLLNLCEGLGIRSPRRAYVLSRVLPEVDAANNSEDSPLSLAEVRELAKRCSIEYDGLRDDAIRTAQEAGFTSAEDALRAFEREQLALAVTRVQTKLLMFQEDLPLLKSCVNALST
ncbi:hypothetical protein LSCM4_06763 [Leishmania orientalis]|uniref:Uncharacterized protein n=1 Tax=Leishmania orientalis TaxID=2249476 RepID=A0A836HXD0_9TRYP|nr:hypothetical protein LSCM4_06763 [Leishmania orientalis]